VQRHRLPGLDDQLIGGVEVNGDPHRLHAGVQVGEDESPRDRDARQPFVIGAGLRVEDGRAVDHSADLLVREAEVVRSGRRTHAPADSVEAVSPRFGLAALWFSACAGLDRMVSGAGVWHLRLTRGDAAANEGVRGR
jgi:hypothetical protein